MALLNIVSERDGIVSALRTNTSVYTATAFRTIDKYNPSFFQENKISQKTPALFVQFSREGFQVVNSKGSTINDLVFDIHVYSRVNDDEDRIYELHQIAKNALLALAPRVVLDSSFSIGTNSNRYGESLTIRAIVPARP